MTENYLDLFNLFRILLKLIHNKIFAPHLLSDHDSKILNKFLNIADEYKSNSNEYIKSKDKVHLLDKLQLAIANLKSKSIDYNQYNEFIINDPSIKMFCENLNLNKEFLKIRDEDEINELCADLRGPQEIAIQLIEGSTLDGQKGFSRTAQLKNRKNIQEQSTLPEDYKFINSLERLNKVADWFYKNEWYYKGKNITMKLG